MSAMSRVEVVTAGLLVFVLLALAAPGVGAQTSPRPHYEIDLHLDVDAAQADVSQVVAYTNRTGDKLPSLVFHISAAQYGAFDLHAARVGEKTVSPTLDGIVLEVPLPEALAPGQSTEVTFEFSLAVPKPGNLRFGASQGIIALGNWYPVLSVYRQGPLTYDGRLPVGWDRHQHGTPAQLARGLEVGDPFFTDMADYTVSVSLSKPARVAHTGEALAVGAEGALRLRAKGVRDFALAVSERYETASVQVDGTTLTAFYLPEHRAGGRQYLESARHTLAWFNENVTPYPYASLHVAETASNDGAWVGQEYPQVVFISTQITAGPVGMESYLSYLVIHEVVHQWYYGLVGNDQLYEPWVDEALTTHMSYRVMEAADAELGRATWQRLAEQRRREATVWPDRPVDTSIYDYDNESHYFAMVYRKGAFFLEEVRQLMGDEAYLAAVRDFTERFSGRFASGRDLLASLEKAGGEPVRLLVGRHFSYPEYLDAPAATVTATPQATAVETPEPAPATATPLPSPTASPTPAATPSPTATPAAVHSPTAEPSPGETATPMPPAAGGPTLPDQTTLAAGAIGVTLALLVVAAVRSHRSRDNRIES